MKKFLFTLAALLMAGSLCAQEDYFYVEDFEVSQELLQQPTGKARRMTVNVYAHFDYMVSSWQVNMYLPEGVAIKNAEALEGMTIHGMDAVGNPKDYAVALASNFDTQRFIGASMEAGYYYPEGSDPDEDDPVTIGANKWLPGDYLMFSMTLQFDQDFQGGELTIESMLACGQDPRPGTCPKGETNTRVTNITVEGGQVVPQDLTGEIVVSEPTEDGIVTVAYTGEENVTIKVNGEEYNGENIQLVEGENTLVVTVEAEGYNTKEETFVVTWTAPVPQPQYLTGEILIGDADENGYVTIAYTGEEDVTIKVMVDGIYVPMTDGKIFLGAYGEAEVTVEVTAEGYEPMTATKTVNWEEPVLENLTGEIVVSEPDENGVVTVTYTGEEEVTVTVTVNGEPVDGDIVLAEGENTIVVTVEAAGYNTMEQTFVVTWTAPLPPYQTPAPEVTVDVQETQVVITATGEGTVTLYVNGQAVENPYIIARTDEVQFVTVYATAQRDADSYAGISESMYVEIPELEGQTDPHMQGYWLVAINANGGYEWYQMVEGSNGDYTTTLALDYDKFGYVYYDAQTAPVRHAVDYFIMINGVRYGAPEAEVNTVLGTALDNELFAESEGYYTLPVGYNYNMGVAIGPDGDYYVYAAQANFTGVDELNANKTVAGVRYFNLAGQEMQEANGMTIVVTTYTDGTTSAVKVMK